MRAVAFIVPGLTEGCRRRPYQEIGKAFKKKGITPIFADINWPRRVMSDYVAEFTSIYQKQSRKFTSKTRIYFFGMSFGAFICFIAATKLRVDRLILCSLSPYFREDLPKLRLWWLRYSGKRRVADLKRNFSFTKLVKLISAKAILLVGEKEPTDLLQRVAKAHQVLKHSQLILIPNTKHDIGQPSYLTAVQKLIASL